MKMNKFKFILATLIVFIFVSCNSYDYKNPEVTQTIEFVEDEFVYEDYSPYYARNVRGYKLTTTSHDLEYIDYHTDIKYIDSIQCIRYDEIKEKQKNIYKIRDNIENKECD
jgi:hypothetical protein